MGTTYSVKAHCPGSLPEAEIATALDRFNGLASSFDEDSELMAFNRAPVGVEVAVSQTLVEAVATARLVAEQTDGAFDVTVAPLVALWGFGAGAASEPPGAAQVDAALAMVGYDRLRHQSSPPRLAKLAPVSIDLSAIAKGLAVDRLAELLNATDCDAYLIELGGELRVAGPSPGGGPWRLAVESPGGGTAASVIVLRNGAVATSGDYRQYREHDGARISHIIDPRDGRPLAHHLASVTVVAASAQLADAYATALMVLGEPRGRRFAEHHGLAALFISRAGDGFTSSRSTAMNAYLQ